MSDTERQKAARMGRPAKGESELRHRALLDAALDHFLSKGFETTTIDAITASAGMSKRTVYKLYPDKVSLFYASVRQIIERAILSDEEIAAVQMEHLESTLLAVAFLRFRFLKTPEGVKMQRIMASEAHRFPDLVEEAYARAQLPINRFVAEQIRRHARPGTAAYEQPDRAANAFMSQALSTPTRMLTFGSSVSEREIEETIIFGVRLFLEGVRTEG